MAPSSLSKTPACGQMLFPIACSASIPEYSGKMEDPIPNGCVNARSRNTFSTSLTKLLCSSPTTSSDKMEFVGKVRKVESQSVSNISDHVSFRWESKLCLILPARMTQLVGSCSSHSCRLVDIYSALASPYLLLSSILVMTSTLLIVYLVPQIVVIFAFLFTCISEYLA